MSGLSVWQIYWIVMIPCWIAGIFGLLQAYRRFGWTTTLVFFLVFVSLALAIWFAKWPIYVVAQSAPSWLYSAMVGFVAASGVLLFQMTERGQWRLARGEPLEFVAWMVSSTIVTWCALNWNYVMYVVARGK